MERSWDDLHWKVSSDTARRAGCRWLQSWWRQTHLGLPPGPFSKHHRDRVVASSLPLDAPGDANLLSEQARRAAEARLQQEHGSGLIDEDRLRRNLLSSQPLCFNLFGHLAASPAPLLGWVRGLDTEADRVTAVRLEWAPPRAEHFHGGSAFDALVEYATAEDRRRFLGVECKYAENLADSRISVGDRYRQVTTPEWGWHTDAAERLKRPRLVQLWLNTLLAQSLARRDGRYETGTAVVLTCAADTAARSATDGVRAELAEPDRWLRWSSYEDVLEQLDGAGSGRLARALRDLDFSPVRHLLRAGDPRGHD